MANLESNSKISKRKKHSLSVDLTPMVDLAFLLIAFFMLTTQLSKPVAMIMNMPVENHPRPVPLSKVLTLIVDKNNVYYYEGDKPAQLLVTDFSKEGLRKVILNKQSKVKTIFGDPKQTICLIKMTDDADYKSMVDVLDEMDITNTKIYALQKLNDDEKKALVKKS